MDVSRCERVQIEGRPHARCPLEVGDTLDAVCFHFGVGDWRPVYGAACNREFRERYSDLDPQYPYIAPSRGSGGEPPPLLIPLPSGASGSPATVQLSPLATLARHVLAIEQQAGDPGTTLTYLRKAFHYDNPFWDTVIPRARTTVMPASMQSRPEIRAALAYLERMATERDQDWPVSGRWLDMGHLFAGLNARYYAETPSRLTCEDLVAAMVERRFDVSSRVISSVLNRAKEVLGITTPALRFGDNLRVATWVPDLGSAVAEFMHQLPNRRAPVMHLQQCYSNWASTRDMRGNADAYRLNLQRGSPFHQQFRSFYIDSPSPAANRLPEFCRTIGLRNDAQWMAQAAYEVLSAVIGYIGANAASAPDAAVWREDLMRLFSDLLLRALGDWARDLVRHVSSGEPVPWVDLYARACLAILAHFRRHMQELTPDIEYWTQFQQAPVA